MRSCLPSVLAASLALALPAFASTTTPALRPHHRSAHPHHVAASRCGEIAGHASHTVLAAPAAVPCHTVAAHAARAARVNRAIASATRPAPIVTEPAPARAAIASVPRAHAPLARTRFVPPLRGSLASLERQNERDEAEGLTRIEDDAQLDELEAGKSLVPVPVSDTLRVNPDLPANRRYCRPWTARFLRDLARSHYARFHRALQVNSAVRTVAFQRELMQINGNAAPAEGDIASPHLTGAAIDIGKKGMSFSELSWMRAWLLPLQTAGKIDVEEEFYQSCFHVTVYRSYTPLLTRPAPPRLVVARRRHSTTTLLAARVH